MHLGFRHGRASSWVMKVVQCLCGFLGCLIRQTIGFGTKGHPALFLAFFRARNPADRYRSPGLPGADVSGNVRAAGDALALDRAVHSRLSQRGRDGLPLCQFPLARRTATAQPPGDERLLAASALDLETVALRLEVNRRSRSVESVVICRTAHRRTEPAIAPRISAPACKAVRKDDLGHVRPRNCGRSRSRRRSIAALPWLSGQSRRRWRERRAATGSNSSSASRSYSDSIAKKTGPMTSRKVCSI